FKEKRLNVLKWLIDNNFKCSNKISIEYKENPFGFIYNTIKQYKVQFHLTLKCPNWMYFHKAELFGSWNNWTIGIKANFRDMQVYKKYESYFIAKFTIFDLLTQDFLQKHIFEYKWKITNISTGEVTWMLDNRRKIKENNGWNKNNLFYIN